MAVRALTLSLENLESRLNLSGLGGLSSVKNVATPITKAQEMSLMAKGARLTSLTDYSRVFVYANASGVTTSTSFGTGISPPSDLSSSHTSSGINLRWADRSTTEAGYRVYRSTDGTNFELIGTVAKGRTRFSDLTAEAGVQYTYGVAAFNSKAQSVLSNLTRQSLPSDATPAVPTSPSAPSHLQQNTVTQNSVSISWFDEAKDESGYHVYRSDDGENYSLVGDLGPNATSFTDTGLGSGTQYSYSVSSWSAAGETYAMDSLSVVTEVPRLISIVPLNVPATPAVATNVAFTNLGPTSLTLNWTDAATNEAGYHIYRSTDGVNFSKIADLAANSSSFADSGLNSGTTYLYRIAAFNAVGESNTQAAGMTTQTVSSELGLAPNSPTNIVVQHGSSTTLEVNWTDNSANEGGFNIYRSTDGVNYVKVGFTWANNCAFTDVNLSPNKTYMYKVAAWSSDGESYSAPGFGTTATTSATLHIGNSWVQTPNTPSSMWFGNVSTSSLTVGWSDPNTNQQGFNVYRSTDGISYSKIASVSAGTNAYTDTGLTAGTTYYYRIGAFMDAGETFSSSAMQKTSGSAPLQVTPVLPVQPIQQTSPVVVPVAPGMPTQLTVNGATLTSLSLSWSYSGSDEKGFKVYRSTDGTNYTVVTNLDANATSFIDSGLSSSKTYSYKIAAFNDAGETSTNAANGTTLTPVVAPSAPLSVSISSVTTSGLTLNWSDASSNENGFRVYRSTDGVNFTKVADLGANVTTFTDSGLANNTAYAYKIASWNSAGETTTAAVSQQTLQSAPNLPTQLSISNPTISSLQISWSDNSSNESGYRVYRSTDGTNYTLVTSLNANVTSFSDTGLSSGTTYSYKIAAWNGGGETTSPATSGTTQTPAPVVVAPNAPASVTFSNISTSTLTINWSDAANNESGYRVYRSADGVNFAKVADLNANSTSFSDSGLASSTTYYYKIAAWNSAAESSTSAASQKTATPVVNAPNEPTWLTVAYPTTTSLQLYWLDQSNNETGFHVYRSTDGGANYTLIGDAAANSQFYQDNNLTPGMKYTYKVTAFNSGGEKGTWIDSGTTLPVVVAPTAPSALVFSNISTTGLTLNWTDSAANESGYRVYRSTDGVNFSKVADLGANTTSFSDFGLSNNATYYYKVAGWNSGGEASSSAVAQKTNLAAPSAPSQLAVTPTSTTTMTLSWSDTSTTESGFHIYRSTDGWNYSLAGDVMAGITTFTDAGLSASTTYSYKISAWNSGGETQSSAAWGTTQAPVVAPNAPASIIFAGITSSAMTIKWADNASNETGYRVYRSTDGATFSKIADLAANSTSYADSGLSTGATYYYRISAYNSGGETTSTAASQTTSQPAPAAPTWLTVAYPSSTGLQLFWLDNSSNEAGFNVYRSTDGKNFSLIGTAPANSQFFQDTNLQPGTTYTYKVSSFNSGGETDGWISSGTTMVGLPSAPSNAVFSKVTGNSLTLSWTDNAGNETGYRLYRSTDGVNYSWLTDLAANMTSFNDANLAASTTYSYKIVAWNAAGEISTIASQKTQVAAPAAPTWLTVSNPTATGLQLYWIDNSNNETGFHVYRSTDGKNFTFAGDTAANAQFFQDSNLVPGTTYTYKVSAFNEGGVTDGWIASNSTTVLPPNAPTGTNFLSVSYSSMTVYWTDNSANESGFRVYRSTDGTNFSKVADLNANATVFSDTGLNSGATYYYKIAAWNGGGETTAAVVSQSTTVAPPTTPSNLWFSSAGTNGLTVSWTDASNETGYRVYRSTDGVNFSKVADLAANATSFADSGLNDNTTYYYKIAAWNSIAEMPSAVVSKATNAAPPVAPTGVNFTGITSSVLTVNWTDASANESGFRVYRSTDGVNFSRVADVAPGATSYTDTGLNPATTYYYKVSSWNAAGESSTAAASGMTAPTVIVPVSITSRDMTSFTELDIIGTTGNDSILVTQANGILIVTANGQVTTYNAGNYGNLVIRGTGGNDNITVDSSVNIITLIYGGDGNSVIRNLTQAKATIVTIGNGYNVVTGNGINTSYWVNPGDTVNASGAEWALNGVNKITNFYQPFTSDTTNSKYVPRSLNGQNLADPTDIGATTRLSRSSLWGMGPTMNDIYQGSLSDCYFLAPLASLAYSEPQKLINTAVDLGDGTYAFRFTRNGLTQYVRVDGDLPQGGWGGLAYSYLGGSGNAWGVLYEKAYAFFRYGYNTYSSLNFGFQTTTLIDLGFSASNALASGGATSILNTITTQLNAGHAMAASTNPSIVNAPIIGSHVYSVIGAYVDATTKLVMIKLRNPWGVDGAGNDGANDGIVTITYDQFATNFGMLTWSQV